MERFVVSSNTRICCNSSPRVQIQGNEGQLSNANDQCGKKWMYLMKAAAAKAREANVTRINEKTCF
jgi:hypothetical protein